MKKILLLLIMLSATLFSYAQQPCTPGTITAPQSGYIIPDSTTGFNHACAGMYYEQIVYLKAPADTTVTVGGFPTSADVDSFVVDANIIGLPAGLMVETFPAVTPASPGNPKTNFDRLVMPGNSLACVKISGIIPAATPAGSNLLDIKIRAYLSGIVVIGTIDTAVAVDYYDIVVDAPGTGACVAPAGIDDLSGLAKNIMLSPNPAQDILTLSFDAQESMPFELEILDFSGRVVYAQSTKMLEGNNNIPISVNDLSAGTYLLHIKTARGNHSEKLQIQ